MQRLTLRLLAVLLAIAAGWTTWWLSSRPEPATRTSESATAPPPRRVPAFEPLRSQKSAVRPAAKARFDEEAASQGALPGQRWLKFSDAAARDRFLESIKGKGIAVLGSIDALHTLRIGFLNADELAALLDGSEESGMIFPVTVPGRGTIQDGAVGFGAAMLSWLGAIGDRSSWGSGVMVAVLDTGIAATNAITSSVFRNDLVALPGDLSTQNGHGTAVGSLIAGEMGVAPGSTLLSYRVADDTGRSDTFTLAQAILDAADAGAQIINISMGSSGNSSLLREAVEYAQSKGAVIVASAGNDGGTSVSYPAGYPDVISVGAVDANGSHLDFSNQGNVTLSAPGLDVQSAWTGDQTVLFTGTSASAPIISGSIASIMSTQRVTAERAVEILLAQTNEAGAPGADDSYGEGIVDLGRVLRSTDPGATDIAVASNHVADGDDGTRSLLVTVENRGNTTIVNAPLTVTTPAGTYNLNVSTLSSGKTQTFTLPFPSTAPAEGQEFRVESNIRLSNGVGDLNPSNNRRIDAYTTAPNP